MSRHEIKISFNVLQILLFRSIERATPYILSENIESCFFFFFERNELLFTRNSIEKFLSIFILLYRFVNRTWVRTFDGTIKNSLGSIVPFLFLITILFLRFIESLKKSLRSIASIITLSFFPFFSMSQCAYVYCTL